MQLASNVNKRILFLTLRVFSATGGIEKVSRIMGKSLHELSCESDEQALKIYSMYDEPRDLNEKYFPARIFRGFGKKKFRFMIAATRSGIKSRQVILSHINLLLAGFLIKTFAPRTRLILLAHGIEVWNSFPLWKRIMLRKCDLVLAVSNYTKGRILALHGIPKEKVMVFNNCLDPFLKAPMNLKRNGELSRRYALGPKDMVLITLTRLSSRERYKGYDNVFHVISKLKNDYPFIKYLLVGKYDEEEKSRVDELVAQLNLEENIIFTGFIADEEIAAHYNIADLYIMPSKKEGFGIVFIEAMYYGKPVIAGNKDGSVDALYNGKFGLLIDPDSRQEITSAIIKVMNDKAAYIPNQQEVMDKFSYPVYKERLRKILAGRVG